jgi:enoyl-CoA hydratase
MPEFVHLETQGPVAVVTIDRPDALNALNGAVIDGFGEAIVSIEADPGIRAVVVSGAGRAFAAGADIAEMKEMTPLQAEAHSAKAHRIFGRLEELPIPTIA